MDSMGFRATGKQVAATSYYHTPPPPPPTTSYFSQQAFRVPYNQCDESLTDMAAYRNPDFGQLFRLPSRNVLGEEYELEMEKEKIRCRMIAAEILRKRSLIAALRGPFPDDFSLIAASSALRPRFSALCESRAIEERLALCSEERLPGCWNRSGIAGFQRIETVAFRRVPEPRVSEIEPSLEATSRQRIETVAFQRVPEPRVSEIEPSLEEAMLGKNQSGAKRKAVTPLEEGASELHSVDLKKKPKEETQVNKVPQVNKEDWSCSTCQVIATSEQSLNQHLRGKKHKAREALGAGKNYAIGFFPKIVRQPIE